MLLLCTWLILFLKDPLDCMRSYLMIKFKLIWATAISGTLSWHQAFGRSKPMILSGPVCTFGSIAPTARQRFLVLFFMVQLYLDSCLFWLRGQRLLCLSLRLICKRLMTIWLYRGFTVLGRGRLWWVSVLEVVLYKFTITIRPTSLISSMVVSTVTSWVK